MKILTDYRTNFCNYKILKIQNGYLIKIEGICEGNKNYEDYIYNATPKETFNQFKFLVSLGGGKIEYDVNQIEWLK